MLAIAYIEFLDSESSHGWNDPEIPSASPTLASGFLIAENDIWYVLGVGHDPGTGQANAILSVPKCAVQSIIKLTIEDLKAYASALAILEATGLAKRPLSPVLHKPVETDK